MLFCFFEYWYMCVLHSIFVSEVIYFSHQNAVIVQSVWHSLLLRNNLFVLARRTTAIVLWAKLLGCEELNKRGFKLLSPCFFVFCFAKLRILQTTETYSPQTFLVTAAVVAPAVVLCLKSLLTNEGTLVYLIKKKKSDQRFPVMPLLHSLFLYDLTCLIIHSYFIFKKNMSPQRFMSRLSTCSLERLESKGRYPLRLNPSKRALTWFLAHANAMDSCISCSNFVGFAFLPFLLVFGLIETLSQRPLQSTSVPGLLVLLNTVNVTFSV